MLDRVAVAIPWPEGGKRRVCQNIRASGGDQNGKPDCRRWASQAIRCSRLEGCSFQVAAVFATASLSIRRIPGVSVSQASRICIINPVSISATETLDVSLSHCIGALRNAQAGFVQILIY